MDTNNLWLYLITWCIICSYFLNSLLDGENAVASWPPGPAGCWREPSLPRLCEDHWHQGQVLLARRKREVWEWHQSVCVTATLPTNLTGWYIIQGTGNVPDTSSKPLKRNRGWEMDAGLSIVCRSLAHNTVSCHSIWSCFCELGKGSLLLLESSCSLTSTPASLPLSYFSLF